LRARPGRRRAELLAELVSLRRSIVVAAHTARRPRGDDRVRARRLGLDPSFLIGGEIPSSARTRGRARAGSSSRATSRTGRSRCSRPRSPSSRTSTSTTTASSARSPRSRSSSTLARACAACRARRRPPAVAFELAVPGEHNRRNAAASLAALELAGVSRADAEQALREFRGAGRRFELRGGDGVRVYDDYAHNPAKIAAALAAARELEPSRVLVLFQPHLYSRTRYLAHELAAALASADVVAVTDIYAAREEPVAAVSGKLVVDALVDRRNGMTVAWTPSLDDGATFLAERARPGDLVLTVGAGDVDRAAGRLVEELA
jgi:UDP-N-acetylmuramate--alanine ligase